MKLFLLASAIPSLISGFGDFGEHDWRDYSKLNPCANPESFVADGTWRTHCEGDNYFSKTQCSLAGCMWQVKAGCENEFPTDVDDYDCCYCHSEALCVSSGPYVTASVYEYLANEAVLPSSCTVDNMPLLDCDVSEYNSPLYECLGGTEESWNAFFETSHGKMLEEVVQTGRRFCDLNDAGQPYPYWQTLTCAMPVEQQWSHYYDSVMKGETDVCNDYGVNFWAHACCTDSNPKCGSAPTDWSKCPGIIQFVDDHGLSTAPSEEQVMSYMMCDDWGTAACRDDIIAQAGEADSAVMFFNSLCVSTAGSGD